MPPAKCHFVAMASKTPKTRAFRPCEVKSMRRVMTLYAVNAWLLLSGQRWRWGGPPQASSTTQLGTAAAAAYEAENWSESLKSYGIVTSTGSDARGRQPF